VGARFFAPVYTGFGDHPTSYTRDTWSLPGLKRLERGVVRKYDHFQPIVTHSVSFLKMYHAFTPIQKSKGRVLSGLTFMSLDSRWEYKNSELYGSRHSSTIICPELVYRSNSSL
jgi:hypothetical protein